MKRIEGLKPIFFKSLLFESKFETNSIKGSRVSPGKRDSGIDPLFDELSSALGALKSSGVNVIVVSSVVTGGIIVSTISLSSPFLNITIMEIITIQHHRLH